MDISQSKFNIDKNLAFNVRELRREEDTLTEKIIKSLLIYFSLSYQEDLWGYKTLDPYDFAKVMKISRANLFRSHPEPEYLKSKNAKKEYAHLWDSYLENALFILSSKSLFQEYKGVTLEFEYVGIRNFIIIKDIQLLKKKVDKKNDKFYYRYQLDEVFERNIRRFFLQTRVDIFIECGQKNIEDFYLHIMNLYSVNKVKEDNQYFFNLDTLTDFFEISTDLEPRKQKNKVNKYLKTTTEILKNEIPGLNFEWVSHNGQRWKYTLKMIWTKVSEQELKNERYFVMQSTFLKFLRRNLFELYKSQYEGLYDNESFWYWLRNEKDMEIKISSYINTLAMHQKLPEYPSPEVLANGFFKKVRATNNLEELEQIFILNQKEINL